MSKYYLQDKRQYVGNDMLWWAKDGAGYTTDVSKAEVFDKDSAFRQHKCRPDVDIPWLKSYIDQKTRPAVDMQYTDIDEGTDIELIKLKPPKKDVFNCHGCGRFLSERDIYSDCQNCGADNRP